MLGKKHQSSLGKLTILVNNRKDLRTTEMHMQVFQFTTLVLTAQGLIFFIMKGPETFEISSESSSIINQW